MGSHSAGKHALARRCSSWRCLTSSSTWPCWSWWNSPAGTDNCATTSHWKWMHCMTALCFLLFFFHFRMLVDNVSNKLVQSFGRQEFVVPSNVLGLVYGQTVVWMGALFCPLLPLINVAKFIILFYIKKVTHLVLTSVTYMAEIGCCFFFPLLDFNSTYT